VREHADEGILHQPPQPHSRLNATHHPTPPAQIDDAEQRRVVVEDVVRNHVANKDRAAAKQALIGKKRLTKQLAAYRAYARDLEMLHDSLEQTEDQKAFVKEMKSANKVLKKQKMTSSINSVEDLLEDMDDHRQNMDEFHDTLTSRTVVGDDIDDELAALFGDDSRPITMHLPVAPVGPVAPVSPVAPVDDLNVLAPV
jgi:DNA mismatch repair ATPase MutS